MMDLYSGALSTRVVVERYKRGRLVIAQPPQIIHFSQPPLDDRITQSYPLCYDLRNDEIHGLLSCRLKSMSLMGDIWYVQIYGCSIIF